MEQEVITKISQTLTRDDGSEVKIVATRWYNSNLDPTKDVYVLRRENPDANWEFLSDTPHPDWKTMPREEYIKYGRSPMRQAVTFAEICKVTQWLGQPLSALQ